MIVEKPLDLEQFFITRNEIASRHNSRLELQAMSRIREHIVENQRAKATQPVAQAKPNKK